MIPEVYIYILNHNYGRYFEQCLESILDQTYSNIKLKNWIKKIQNSQAGEIIISSIMHDGMFDGPDYELLNLIKKLDISVPVIYTGGIRNIQDVRETLTKKINSVGISHSLHFEKFN